MAAPSLPVAPWAALALVGAWSVAPPYVGPSIGLELDGVASSVEVVDHVVPGGLVVCVALAIVFAARRGRIDPGALAAPAAAGVCLLAGLWITTSHVPLVLDAGDAARPWDAVLLHASAGPPVLAVAAVLLART